MGRALKPIETLPDTMPETVSEWSRDLIKAIAMDIGKDTVAYVEVMYPGAITATSSTFKLSLRNHIYNQIMAAIEVTDEGKVIARLRERKAFRRWWVGVYRNYRRRATATATAPDDPGSGSNTDTTTDKREGTKCPS